MMIRFSGPRSLSWQIYNLVLDNYAVAEEKFTWVVDLEILEKISEQYFVFERAASHIYKREGLFGREVFPMNWFASFFWNKEEEVWDKEVKSRRQKRGLYTCRARVNSRAQLRNSLISTGDSYSHDEHTNARHEIR